MVTFLVLDKQAKKSCVTVGIEDGLKFLKTTMSIYRTMCLQYNNFNFDTDFMQLCTGNQSVSNLQSVIHVFRIHRHTLT